MFGYDTENSLLVGRKSSREFLKGTFKMQNKIVPDSPEGTFRTYLGVIKVLSFWADINKQVFQDEITNNEYTLDTICTLTLIAP